MNQNLESVTNWIKKAENDLKIGKGELETEEPVTDAICFHMQQCAEKYLKSFLVFHGHEIIKTHNLYLILKECIAIDPSF